MQTTTTAPTMAKPARWAGYTLSALATAFLTFDSVIKVLQLAPAVEATTQLGYPVSVIFGLGLVQLVCLALTLVPRTAVFGAILLTGYLGGAIATHVRAGSPLFSLLFPAIVGALVWGGLWLRDPQLRALIPIRRG